MEANTIALPVNGGLTFNVFYREDTRISEFVRSLVVKAPEHWAYLRSVLDGQDCSVYWADRSVNTPFDCLWAARTISDLQDMLGIRITSLHLMLKSLRESSCLKRQICVDPFPATELRNRFLSRCIERKLGTTVKVNFRKCSIGYRDLKIVAKGYVLYIRFEGGVANGWELKDKSAHISTADQILEIDEYQLKCQNIYNHSFSKNGIFINFDLQPRMNVGT